MSRYLPFAVMVGTASAGRITLTPVEKVITLVALFEFGYAAVVVDPKGDTSTAMSLVQLDARNPEEEPDDKKKKKDQNNRDGRNTNARINPKAGRQKLAEAALCKWSYGSIRTSYYWSPKGLTNGPACRDLCRDAGKAYFALECAQVEGSECWCADADVVDQLENVTMSECLGGCKYTQTKDCVEGADTACRGVTVAGQTGVYYVEGPSEGYYLGAAHRAIVYPVAN